MRNKQEADNVTNSLVNQVNGNQDNHFGISVKDAIDICRELMDNKIKILTSKAKIIAEKRNKEMEDRILKSVREDLFSYFNDPAIQFALNETYMGYIKTGDTELGDNLLNLLIDRLEAKEGTIELFTIDEA